MSGDTPELPIRYFCKRSGARKLDGFILKLHLKVRSAFSSLLSFPLSLLIFIALTGCATQPAREAPTVAPLGAPPQVENEGARIDYDALEGSLGLAGSVTDLGYKEQAFNTCRAGYGFSSTHDCRTQVLTVIRFRLSCRESDGTEQNADYRQTPVEENYLKWTLGNQRGTTSTNSEGYGFIRALFSSSNKSGRLKLILGNNFLAIRAEDMSRVVAPKSFCSSK